MASKELEKRISDVNTIVRKSEITQEYADAMYQYGKYAIWTEKDLECGLKCLKTAKEWVIKLIEDKTHGTIWQLDEYCFAENKHFEIMDLYYKILLEESLYNLESFIYYMERKREPNKRFYLPRKDTLGVVLNDLEDLANRKIKFYGLSLPSRTGKSSLCIFFLAWIGLKRPNSHSAMGGHSGMLAKGFYKELMNLFSTEEYCFEEMFEYFHQGHTCIREKSAEEYTITLDKPDRFATFTCRGIDTTWTGAVDVSWDGILYVDDLVRDREHSLSPTRMENTFQEYLNKMVDRKSGYYPGYGEFAGACELMVGTLWNVLDPLERLRNMYDGNPLYRFRRIPALNDKDESNFNYKVNGFTTEYFKEIRERLDNAEWMAKYQQQPFVREGLILPSDELNYFNGIMPDGNYKSISVCDVAYGGGDSLSMPIGREYENGDVYVYDWIFNNGAKEITIPKVVGGIISNEIRDITFEGNQGGDMYCAYVDDELKKNNYKCSCSSRKAPNTMAKMEKIVAYSGDIKRKFYFLSSKQPTKEELEQDKALGIKRYVRSKEYQKAMDEMCSCVSVGKNEHDDSIDSIVQMAMKVDGYGMSATAQAIKNPFRSIGRM